MHNKIQEVTLV